MPVEVRQLRCFVTVADELNFTRAARRLNVVQQTLSAAITQLETLRCDFWRVTEQRTKPATLGPRGRTLEDLLEAARAARATALVPASIATATAWPGLAFIPVPDVPPSSIGVAWPEDGQSSLVRAFVAVANQVATTGVR